MVTSRKIYVEKQHHLRSVLVTYLFIEQINPFFSLNFRFIGDLLLYKLSQIMCLAKASTFVGRRPDFQHKPVTVSVVNVTPLPFVTVCLMCCPGLPPDTERTRGFSLFWFIRYLFVRKSLV